MWELWWTDCTSTGFFFPIILYPPVNNMPPGIYIYIYIYIYIFTFLSSWEWTVDQFEDTVSQAMISPQHKRANISREAMY